MSETKQIDDGGPAFPVQACDAQGCPIESMNYGLSVRDWFAGHEIIADEEQSWELCEALAGKRPDGDWRTNPLGWDAWHALWRARMRYIRADAMLKARAAR